MYVVPIGRHALDQDLKAKAFIFRRLCKGGYCCCGHDISTDAGDSTRLNVLLAGKVVKIIVVDDS